MAESGRDGHRGHGRGLRRRVTGAVWIAVANPVNTGQCFLSALKPSRLERRKKNHKAGSREKGYRGGGCGMLHKEKHLTIT
jgi:hypothetical protein